MKREEWIRLVLWALPIIFMAATMYVTLSMVVEKTSDHDVQIQQLWNRAADLREQQAITGGRVADIEKKTDKLIQTTEKLDDKMDATGQDLAAIKMKLKIPH